MKTDKEQTETQGLNTQYRSGQRDTAGTNELNN